MLSPIQTERCETRPLLLLATKGSSPQQHINAVGSILIRAQQAIRLKRFHATQCTYRCEITVRGTKQIKAIQSVQRIGCFINLPTHQSAAGYEDSKAPSIADAALQRKALLSYEHSFFTGRPGPSGLVTKPCLSHAVRPLVAALQSGSPVRPEPGIAIPLLLFTKAAVYQRDQRINRLLFVLANGKNFDLTALPHTERKNGNNRFGIADIILVIQTQIRYLDPAAESFGHLSEL